MKTTAQQPVNSDARESKAENQASEKSILQLYKSGVMPLQSASAGDAIVQRKEYKIERDINLDLAQKKWKAKGTKGEDGYQSAKTQARGQLYADLREEYPATRNDGTQQEKDATRGLEFAARKAEIDRRYDAISDDLAEVTTSRPAIYKDAVAGKRRKTGQAQGINDLAKAHHEREVAKASVLPDQTRFNELNRIGADSWIGAHLIKREWGGADNMWNVVAWPQDAEDTWADTFEKPVDSRGLRGENPGNVKISVTKEDEVIDADQTDTIIGEEIAKQSNPAAARKRATESPTFFENIAAERSKVNRAVESVPLEATGINQEDRITVTKIATKFPNAVTAASDALRLKTADELKSKDERTDFLDVRPLPVSMADANSKEAKKQLTERKTDWKAEKDTYTKAGGKDKFNFENIVFPE